MIQLTISGIAFRARAAVTRSFVVLMPAAA